jgi:hypothetical protein
MIPPGAGAFMHFRCHRSTPSLIIYRHFSRCRDRPNNVMYFVYYDISETNNSGETQWRVALLDPGV